MNACTCTGQGAVNVMAPTTDKTGAADPGQDATVYGPMCEYTCQRGYCPEGACIEQDSSESGSGSGSGAGSGDVYIAPSIWDDSSPVIQCQPPCSLILPPMPVHSPSVISIPPWTAPLIQSYLTTKTSTDNKGSTVTYPEWEKTTVTAFVSFPTTTISEVPVWGVSINASQTAPEVVELTSSITLPHMTSKDTQINRGTTSTTWSSGRPTPSVSKGSKGSGKSCAPYCRGPCLLCPPEIDISGGGGSGGSGGDSGSGGDNEEDECSTETAQVCSTVCVKGSNCDFDCSTTTGCSVSATSTKIIGTPPPGVAISMEQWKVQTTDPDEVLSSALSLESVFSSMFGTLTILEGPGSKTTATGPAPTNGGDAGRIALYYYSTNVASEAQWEIYDYYGQFGGYDGCPEVKTPSFVKKDGAFAGIHNGDSGLKAFGKSCRRPGNVPI
ncbi:unnamed protein product [Penicillium viridicatum]